MIDFNYVPQDAPILALSGKGRSSTHEGGAPDPRWVIMGSKSVHPALAGGPGGQSDAASLIADHTGVNAYTYAGNDVMNFIDPSGPLTVCVWEHTKEAWGHASIRLDNGTYISWWPTPDPCREGSLRGKNIYTAPALEQTYKRDMQFEGTLDNPKAPYFGIRIDGLDEDAIA